MEQTVKHIESELRNMIYESVKRYLIEDAFKQVDNLNDYVTTNGLQMKPASKFQRVNAQSGKSYINQYGKQNGMDKRQIGRMVRKGAAPLTTVAGDGTQETNNMVTKNHTVLNNVGNTSNKWAAETPTFKRKYEQDPSNSGTYKPKGGPMNAAQINEPISFTAPWGEKMNVDKGGYILQDPNNPNDIYGISGKDFDSTYKFNENKQYKTNRKMRRTIKLTENGLHRIIMESVNRILNEGWQQGSDYMPADWAKEYGYEKNGQGVERTNPSPDRRSYSLRNTDNGYNNHTRINASKGGGVNNMTHMNFGNGGMNAGQLNSIIDELSQYIGATPEEIKAQLGIK